MSVKNDATLMAMEPSTTEITARSESLLPSRRTAAIDEQLIEHLLTSIDKQQQQAEQHKNKNQNAAM